jgi:hypothetical protein
MSENKPAFPCIDVVKQNGIFPEQTLYFPGMTMRQEYDGPTAGRVLGYVNRSRVR